MPDLLGDLDPVLLLGLGHLVDDLLELAGVQGGVVDGDGLHHLSVLEELGSLGIGDLDELLPGELLQQRLLLLGGQPGAVLQAAVRLDVDDGGGGGGGGAKLRAQAAQLRPHHNALLLGAAL